MSRFPLKIIAFPTQHCYLYALIKLNELFISDLLRIGLHFENRDQRDPAACHRATDTKYENLVEPIEVSQQALATYLLGLYEETAITR